MGVPGEEDEAQSDAGAKDYGSHRSYLQSTSSLDSK